jgi:DNA-directed RNA polymerase subunit RPC12/RpoP
MTPEGWRCPSCGSVYAPWVAKCSTCPIRVGRGGHRVTIRQDPDPECDHRWLPKSSGPTVCVKCGATLPDTPKTENPNA